MFGAPPEKVEDTRGEVHRLGQSLGRGGQGAVYATESPRRVVKLLDIRSERERSALAARIRFVRRLDLDGLHIARPLELLASPHAGYLMELLDDMGPLDDLLKPDGSEVRWYIASGGLRRRLRLLAHAGEALAGLHARGLAFVDPSPKNVFVSTDLQHHEAWLIDSDNITVSGEGDPLYTPEYGAPELVTGTGRESTLSDAHAFAVMAFRILSLVHPLLGDVVHDGEPELEDEALTGAWPWIDHPDDDRNRCSRGIPRDMVLSPVLRKLSARAFGDGLRDPLARPAVQAWVNALHSAADATVRCAGCDSTIYVTAPTCPWCDAPAPLAVVGQLVNGWLDPEAESGGAIRMGRVLRGVIALDGDAFTLRRRHFSGASGLYGRQPVARLTQVERGVEIEALADVALSVHFARARVVELGPRPRTLPLDHRDPWDLHLGRPTARLANRVVQVHVFAGGQR